MRQLQAENARHYPSSLAATCPVQQPSARGLLSRSSQISDFDGTVTTFETFLIGWWKLNIILHLTYHSCEALLIFRFALLSHVEETKDKRGGISMK